MMEQTIHSSCSPVHALPLAAMLRAVTARVSATTTAAAIKVSSSFLTATSLLVCRCWQSLLRVEMVRDESVDVDAGSGRGHP